MFKNKLKLSFIGGGNMAGALIAGIHHKYGDRVSIHVIDPNVEVLNKLQSAYSAAIDSSINEQLQASDVIILAVKPQQLREVCSKLAGFLKEQLVISVAAGVVSHDLHRWLGHYQTIVRCMPNTPAMIGLGATGLFALPNVNASQREIAESILSAVGICLWFDDESKLDAVTAISGSGPAYVFYFIEALTHAGVKLGLTQDQASELAKATFHGAATLAAKSDESVTTLRERVTSKGGTTYAALTTMSEANLPALIEDAVFAADRRAKELGEILGRDGVE